MPTVTSQNKDEFVKKQMNKNKAPQYSAGDLADKAWGISAKNFPSQEGASAHREAAKSYRKENLHDLAERHEGAAFSHIQAMQKND